MQLREIINIITKNILKEYYYQPKYIGKYESAAAYVFARNENNEWCVLASVRGGGYNNEDPMQGKWNVPVGCVEDGDKTIEDTAIRECYEETGVRIKNLHIIGEEEWQRGHFGMNFVSVLPQIQKTSNGDGENSRAEWIPLSQAIRLQWAYDMRNWLMKAVRKVNL